VQSNLATISSFKSNLLNQPTQPLIKISAYGAFIADALKLVLMITMILVAKSRASSKSKFGKDKKIGIRLFVEVLALLFTAASFGLVLAGERNVVENPRPMVSQSFAWREHIGEREGK
jgi:hypothetical protein